MSFGGKPPDVKTDVKQESVVKRQSRVISDERPEPTVD
jgi:hypothetical protein